MRQDGMLVCAAEHWASLSPKKMAPGASWRNALRGPRLRPDASGKSACGRKAGDRPSGIFSP